MQIFSYLEPLDLLHLARTNKTFRLMLMSKRVARLSWVQARANVIGVPQCPEDFSEPAFADLLFDDYCHVGTANPSVLFTSLLCISIAFDLEVTKRIGILESVDARLVMMNCM